jgi:Domain of unknown function (DUF4271)
MNISEQEQDIIRPDSIKHRSDTPALDNFQQVVRTVTPDSITVRKKEIRKAVQAPVFADTVSVSARSHISDITFYDSANIITRISKDQLNKFPFLFIEKNRRRETEFKASLARSLREGEKMPQKLFHGDWIVFLVIIAAFFYASLPVYSRKLFPGATRFFLFRGIGEPESRETSELFHWQSTLFNLITFFNLALFVYCAAVNAGLTISGISGFALWLVALGAVIAVITLRHIACIITGWISGQREIFNEYVITIYQTYRYIAFASFVLAVLLVYTMIFPPKILFLTGYVLFAVLYLMRMLRLLLIFLKRNVSLLYFILYLCALEFLPVALAIKYLTGLF